MAVHKNQNGCPQKPQTRNEGSDCVGHAGITDERRQETDWDQTQAKQQDQPHGERIAVVIHHTDHHQTRRGVLIAVHPGNGVANKASAPDESPLAAPAQPITGGRALEIAPTSVLNDVRCLSGV